jgi:signal peptidase I
MNKLVRFLIWTALALGLVIGVARLVAIRWWRVPDNDRYLEASVTPTLRGGDWVLLWRLTKPKVGDLVLCPEPGHEERPVIGRILAEAGDKIRVDGVLVGVNGRFSETEHLCSAFKVATPDTGTEVEQACQVEAVRGVSHLRGATGGHAVAPKTVEEQEVEEGQVFLVSDNRLFPYDSRDFGQVPRDSCKEFVFYRLVGKTGYFDSETRLTYIR